MVCQPSQAVCLRSLWRPEYVGGFLQFSASVMSKSWGCREVVHAIGHLIDDRMES